MEENAFNIDFAKQLVTFNFWENRRVWDNAIMTLSDEQFVQDTGYSLGSIRNECIHIMGGEWSWLHHIRGVAQYEQILSGDVVVRQVIRQRWDSIQQAWEAFVADLTPEAFFAPCEFLFRGEQKSLPTSNLIFHVVNHGTIHRSEILRMVADVSQSIEFDLSMMQYLTGVFRD